MTNWKGHISTMTAVKQELMKQDVEQIWPHHFPKVGANKAEICLVEKTIGYKLDQKYRDFLRYANGWKGLYQTVDLFGIEQLKETHMINCAGVLFHTIEDDVLRESGFLWHQLLPIAVTEFDRDLFTLCLPNSSIPGAVIWFAGEEIDRFENFEEYFLTMIDYNREEVFALRK
ncbi:SMI1/KNR4 family protein [Bacillus pseudomycoides]|uniref:SMI1/KNR4 family protein n=1 Tax=Bacillus pseudomycoides TaxID=64104 RepID=UPI000BF31A0D|nr:SMI1/KNR4 family protein [Bacillus pseudomycoides]PEP60481.1 1,3-beta-glucan synthase regulator [Bacillus pseudomycoides]PHC92158.1 1,3-beta-glucan synthase regulator [Bacillus pseudomycoides]